MIVFTLRKENLFDAARKTVFYLLRIVNFKKPKVDHTNIKERKNDKLHVQHVPKRYWKYLTEKKML
jgi:hypothetical protein